MREYLSKLVYPKVVEGKSDQEIIEICSRYLGECDVEHRYFPKAIAGGMAEFNYADRLWSISRGFDKNTPILDPMERRDLGVSGNPGAQLESLALAALDEEAETICKKGLHGETIYDVLDDEEIDRRVNFVVECCSPEALNEFVKNSLYTWVYVQPLVDLEQQYVGREEKFSDDLKKYLPQFFKMVEILLDHNVDLSKVQMNNGYSVLQVYNIVKEKYSKYLRDGEIIEPEEEVKEEEQEIQPQEEKKEQRDVIDQMMQDIRDKDLTPEEIQKLIEKNNKTISELMDRNKELMEQLMKSMNKKNEDTVIYGVSTLV